MAKSIRLSVIGISVLLAGCSAGPASIAESERPGGLPSEAIAAKPGPSAKAPLDPYPTAGWLDAGARFAVVLGGSSSCPAFPSSLRVLGAQHLRLGINARGDRICTDDLVPRTYVVRTPAGVDPSREVTLEIGETTVLLPPL